MDAAMNLAALLDSPEVLMPAVRVTNDARGVTVDTAAFATAMSTMGVTHPCTVTFTNGRGGRRKYGLHYFDGRVHDIRVQRGIGVLETARTLWHELEHARQSEVLPNFDALYALDPLTFEFAAERVEHLAEHPTAPRLVTA